jgi:uncharacterized protein (DUF952 family)/nucleotide-binding universal stress UspA family protein
MADEVAVRRVVCGIDPSAGAATALRWACGLCAHFDAELIVVHARGLLEGASGDDHPEWVPAAIEVVPPDVQVRLVVLDGPAPEVLLRAADETAADLIVVGRRGAGSPFEASLGSTSREVSSRAAVAVLVVPPARSTAVGGVLLHIISRSDWAAARSAGSYRPASLAGEGFIHLSRGRQVLIAADTHYAGRSDLVLLVLDEAALPAGTLVDEAGSPPHEESIFPHLYGELPLEAVMSVVEFPCEADGSFRWPSALGPEPVER